MLREQNLHLISAGCSFRTATLSFREVVFRFLTEEAKREGFNRLFGCVESTFIATCNRIELFLVTEDAERTLELLSSLLSKKGLYQEEKFYFYQEEDVVKHLLRVSCGLDSEALFEEQIREQLIRANIHERLARNSRGVLSTLFDFCYNMSGKLRDFFKLPSGVSLALAAYRVVETMGIQPKKTLLIGSGKTISILAEKLDRRDTYIYTHRKKLPERLSGITKVNNKNLKSIIRKVDLVISATVAKKYVIEKGDLGSENKVIIDLGFPRNVDPEVGKLRNVVLFDLDRLAPLLPKEVPNVHELEREIEREAESFFRYIRATKLQRTLPLIYIWAERIRKKELDRALKAISNSQSPKEALEAMSKSIVSKLLHPVSNFARREEASDVLETMFGGVIKDGKN